MTDATNPAVQKKKGRSPFSPTDAQRAEVSRLAASQTHEAIAAAVGCSVPTLRKHFVLELKNRLGSENLFDASITAAPPAAPRRRKPRPPGAGGRPAREPTFEERRQVTQLVAVGMPVYQIAVAIKASEPWLRENFAEELANGAAVRKAEVVELIFRSARRGSVPAQRLLRETFERAELAKVNDALSAQDDAARAAKARPLGKKEQADEDAARVMSESSWADVLDSRPN